MIVGIIILSILTLLMITMAIIILLGKGDNLIAGYNTASEKERQQYNIKRLRLVVGMLCIIEALLCWLLITENSLIIFGAIALMFVIAFVAVLLSNTWCKKK